MLQTITTMAEIVICCKQQEKLMTYTTIDIKNLKRVKKKAVDRNMTLKELVNNAIDRYLREVP